MLNGLCHVQLYAILQHSHLVISAHVAVTQIWVFQMAADTHSEYVIIVPTIYKVFIIITEIPNSTETFSGVFTTRWGTNMNIFCKSPHPPPAEENSKFAKLQFVPCGSPNEIAPNIRYIKIRILIDANNF